MGWDGIFDVCDVEIVVFYVALFDEVVCYSGDVVAVVDVGKLVYLGQKLFSKGVYNKSAEIEKVVMSFWLASCHFLFSFSDSTNFKHFRDALALLLFMQLLCQR